MPATGEVTITGTGSSWTNEGVLLVGEYGNGTLNIADGAGVTVGRTTYVAHWAGSTGLIHFADGTLTTGSLWASAGNLTGTGTIHTHGLVSDVDLVFDSATELNPTLTLNGQADQNIVLDLDMSDPESVGPLGVGYRGNSSLTIRDGLTVLVQDGYVGYGPGSVGSATVTGTGSTWAMKGSLVIGEKGIGTLTMVDGGKVTVAGTTYVRRSPDSTGSIDFGTDGALTTKGLWALPSQLRGTGTIDTHGLVSDVDLVFDSTHGLAQTLTFDHEPGQNVRVNLDMASDPSGNATLGVGYHGTGSLTIRDGVEVHSSSGQIGCESGSTGVVTVDGARWISNDHVEIGVWGSGTFTIAGGAKVSSKYAGIGYGPDATGAVTVTGLESRWDTTGNYVSYIGYYGEGTLTIEDGAAVNSRYTDIGSEPDSMGLVVVTGAGSTWSTHSLRVGDEGHGTMRITDGGTVSSTGYGHIAADVGSTGFVTVSGIGAAWTCNGDLSVGGVGSATLSVTDGGLVDVRQTLTIDYNGDGDSFINMSTGGMLALYGDVDDSLSQFLDLINGTDAIRYWDDSVHGWAPITGATPGIDYTLAYINDAGNRLKGYTVLTVTAVPEPGGLALLAGMAVMGMIHLRRRKA
jgi:T5SS/PEP-CTERM-associated repeat protein